MIQQETTLSITEKIKQLHLPLGEYVVVGSGILEALHIRKSNDIDIAVIPLLHKQLRDSGEWTEEERHGKIFLKRENIDIIPQLDWKEYNTTTEEAIASSVVIDGVPFMNLNELCKFKAALGRDKDFKDIKLIQEYRKK